MQLRQLRPAVLPPCSLLMSNTRASFSNRFAPPGRNVGRMQVVLGRHFRYRLVALDRFQRYLGLKLSQKPSRGHHGGSSSVPEMKKDCAIVMTRSVTVLLRNKMLRARIHAFVRSLRHIEFFAAFVLTRLRPHLSGRH